MNAGSEGLKFRNGPFPIFGIQGFDRVPNDGDSAAALEQTLGCEPDAEFRDHAKHDEFDIGTKALHQFVGVAALEDVERLLLQQDLLVARKVGAGKPLARWGQSRLSRSALQEPGSRRECL